MPAISLHALLGQPRVMVADLERWYVQARADPRVTRDAIAAMEQCDAAVAWRAVWVLRQRALDDRITPADLVRIALAADGVTHWAGRLLLCQMFARTGCPEAGREALGPFLQECMRDKRVITRAWALSALCHFRSDPELKRVIEAHLRTARRDPGKAMQARLRQLKLT